MAQYVVTYKANKEVKHELEFMGETFDYTMIPVLGGAKSDKKAFEIQLSERFPGLDDELVDLIEQMTNGEDEAEEAIAALTEYESECG